MTDASELMTDSMDDNAAVGPTAASVVLSVPLL